MSVLHGTGFIQCHKIYCCDSQLDQLDWLKEANSLDGVGLTMLCRLSFGVGYGYRGKTMEMTQTYELD